MKPQPTNYIIQGEIILKFQLLDNGVDSLNMGLDFFDKYLQFNESLNREGVNNKNSYLKLAVICVQNTIEILTKVILSSYNELLIYTDMDKMVVLLGEYKNSDMFEHFYDYLIENDKNVKTIDYSLCIERLNKIYPEKITEIIASDLINIGYERNKLTHFGVSKQLDYHKLIGLICRVLTTIHDVYLPLLEPNIEGFSDLLRRTKRVQLDGNMHEKSEWNKATYTELLKLNDVFTNMSRNLVADSIECIVSPDDEMSTYDIELYKSDEEKVYFETEIVHELDAMYFLVNLGLNADKVVFAVIDFSNPSFIYEYKLNDSYQNLIKKKLWNTSKNQFSRQELSAEVLTRIFKNTFNKEVNR